MPKRTNPFQQLSTSIMAAFYGSHFDVEESVLIKSETTGAIRELDIQVRHRRDSRKSLLVECRDHKRPQDVQWIDQLDGKARSLKFTHVIAVSSSGFSKTAAAEAKERGITAIHLRESEQIDWKTWKFGIPEFRLTLDDRLSIRSINLVAADGAVVPADYSYRDAILLLTNPTRCIRLSAWVNAFQNDIHNLKRFAPPDEPNSIQHYRWSSPCDPGVGFSTLTNPNLCELKRIELSIDRARFEFVFPMRHYRLGSERFHVGTLQFMGSELKLVLQEKNSGDRLLMMLEHKIPKGYSGPLFDHCNAGKLKVQTTDGGTVVCPQVELPDFGLQSPQPDSLPNERDSGVK